MLIPPGYAELTLLSEIAAGYRPAMTSVGFVAEGADTDEIGVIAAAWGDFWAGAGLPSTSRTTGCIVKIGTSDPSAPLTFTSSVSQNGSGSATLMPPNNSLLVTKRTNLGGRRGRGRNYICPVREDKADNVGVLDTDYVLNVEAGWLDVMEAAEGVLGGPPVLLHTEDVYDPSVITAMTLEGTIATQRRRLVRSS